MIGRSVKTANTHTRKRTRELTDVSIQLLDRNQPRKRDNVWPCSDCDKAVEVSQYILQRFVQRVEQAQVLAMNGNAPSNSSCFNVYLDQMSQRWKALVRIKDYNSTIALEYDLGRESSAIIPRPCVPPALHSNCGVSQK